MTTTTNIPEMTYVTPFLGRMSGHYWHVGIHAPTGFLYMCSVDPKTNKITGAYGINDLEQTVGGKIIIAFSFAGRDHFYQFDPLVSGKLFLKTSYHGIKILPPPSGAFVYQNHPKFDILANLFQAQKGVRYLTF